MLLNGRKVRSELDNEQLILLAIEDITEYKRTESELRMFESRYRRLFQTAKDGILILNAETGKIVDVNPFLIELLGYSKDKFIEKEIWELGFFKDIAANKEKLIELQQEEFIRYEDLPLETATGKKINVEFVSNVYLENNHKVIQCNIRDISKRKEKENGLEKTRKELEVIKESADEVSEFAMNIINTVREPLLILNKELRVVNASSSFYNFFKVSPEETIGTLIYDLGNHQWNIPKLRELLETILPEKTTFDNYEVKHDFSTIGKRIMLLNARQIKRRFGKEKMFLLAIEDITERKKIENGLEKTRKELVIIKNTADEASELAENIINTVREPLLLLDKELRVVKASHSFFDFFKVSSKETIGTLIYDLGNQQWNIPKLRELLETILPEKTTFDNYEVEHDFSTIGKRVMLLNARKIQRGLGKEQIILLAIEDITRRKNIENELTHAKAEAERANYAKSEFLSRMSHELRTPMNAILGFAQLMDMGELNPAHKKGVNQILKSGKHLLELINEVLDIAKIETGKLTISPEPVEIYGIILETLDIVSRLAEENNITLESDASTAEKIYIKTDQQRLKQVLLNLINNAVKYNIRGGSVKVVCSKQKSVDKNENMIRIDVIDTGKGIAEEYIKKLFNPFERIGAERTETEGTGLGLAISEKLTVAIGGKIGVESVVGKGSTFWIELPQTESQSDKCEQITELERSKIGANQNSGTILYIEDNLSNIQLVEQILEIHRSSIKLVTNKYGKNAVQYSVDYKPNLILLDLNLPDIHGTEVMKLLQAEPRTADIPVIILSAEAMTKKNKLLVEAGAVDYLIKPIDVVKFLSAVDEWITKRRGVPENKELLIINNKISLLDEKE
jgi:PAS domain S-box-containing protein